MIFHTSYRFYDNSNSMLLSIEKNIIAMKSHLSFSRYTLFLVAIMMSIVFLVPGMAEYPSSSPESDSPDLPFSDPISDNASETSSDISSVGDETSLSNHTSFSEEETAPVTSLPKHDNSFAMSQYMELGCEFRDNTNHLEDGMYVIDPKPWLADPWFIKNNVPILGIRLFFNVLALKPGEKLEIYDENKALVGTLDSSMSATKQKEFISGDYHGKKVYLKPVPEDSGPFFINRMCIFFEDPDGMGIPIYGQLRELQINEKTIDHLGENYYKLSPEDGLWWKIKIFFSSVNLTPGDQLKIYNQNLEEKICLTSASNSDIFFGTPDITGKWFYLKLYKGAENSGKPDSTFTIYRMNVWSDFQSPEPEPDQTNISVTSTPSGATVFVNGVVKGTTPLVLSDVTAGNHTLTIKKIGYNTWSDTIAVSTGEMISIHAPLVKVAKTGYIYTLSYPTGAEIFIDGITTGSTTNSIVPDVPVGYHTVHLKKPGYRDFYKRIRISEGTTVLMRANLIPA